VATRDVRLLRHQLGQVFALPREYTFLNYLRCHDDIGWGLDYPFLQRFGMGEVPHKRYLNDYLTGRFPGSPARGELYNDDPRLGDARLCGTTASLCGIESARQEETYEKLDRALRLDLTLHACMFTLSGIPVLYAGDEIGQENDYGYHDDPMKAADSRYLHRGRMDWTAAEKRADPETPEGRLFQSLRQMEKAREEHRVFDGQADVWLLDTRDDSALGIGRYREGEKLLALFNFADSERTVSLPDELGEYRDLLDGGPADKSCLRLPAGGFLWLICEFTTD
jgi:amylosucrase